MKSFESFHLLRKDLSSFEPDKVPGLLCVSNVEVDVPQAGLLSSALEAFGASEAFRFGVVVSLLVDQSVCRTVSSMYLSWHLSLTNIWLGK